MRTKFKRWAVDYLIEHPDRVINEIDFTNPFFDDTLEVEIGSGKGDFIIQKARMNPNVHFLAIEKVRTVAGMMAKKLDDEVIDNVRVVPLDIATIFESFKKESINKIYLNFSDPWPKKKHAKRRLTYISFLENYYSLLKNNSYLIIKTDNDSLYDFSLEQIELSKFTLVKAEFDYIFESDDAMSEYEKKFREVGNKIHRIILKKERS